MSARRAAFAGGLRLDGAKGPACEAAVERPPLPELLVLPLQQHIGEPAEAVVKPGQRVRRGEVLARPRGYVSVPLHAPTSGTVRAIEPRRVPHPSALEAACVVLEPDGEDVAIEAAAPSDWTQLRPEAVRARIREAGLVGLGGAGFPTFIKLNPGPERPVDTLVVNGAECEPCISCDDRLMRERAEAVVAGARVLRLALGARNCVIAVEDNKPQALVSLRAAAADGVEVREVPTRYPAGDERLLVKAVTGREISSEGLPADVGVVMQNVATAAAAYGAVALGEPLIRRLVTVTGGALTRALNLEVLLGTPVRALLEHCGWREEEAVRLVMGGPMMGFTLSGADVPVVKTSNCVLAADAADFPLPAVAQPCIRCGRCADACPIHLLPQQLFWHARARDFDKIQDYHLFDCIECGCCAYVCPSQIPLVQFYRFAKTEIWALERERERADIARGRHEFRLERLENEKRERARRHAAKKQALADKSGAAKSPSIEDALERARVRAADDRGGAAGGSRGDAAS